MRIPVLTYHSLHAPGGDYASNDHVALEADLRIIYGLGFHVVPLERIARYVAGGILAPRLTGRVVGLSCDDGPDVDYFDIDQPGIGLTKSFRRVLIEFQSSLSKGVPPPSLVSFVIASRSAREQLDRACIAGRGEWRDSWWREAHVEGVMRIANHSWDHVHSALDHVMQRDQLKGTFSGIDSLEDADSQILQAEKYIAQVLGTKTSRLFAFPYGEFNDYLVNTYLPQEASRHGLLAAFSTGGDYAGKHSNRWCIPRFVCGEHWKSPDDLAHILEGAAA